jgi:hypothetical protein
MSKEFSTKAERIGDRNYCLYCAKQVDEMYFRDQAQPDPPIYGCDCEGAKITEKIEELNTELYNLEKSARVTLDPIEFEAGVKELKFRYHQE